MHVWMAAFLTLATWYLVLIVIGFIAVEGFRMTIWFSLVFGAMYSIAYLVAFRLFWGKRTHRVHFPENLEEHLAGKRKSLSQVVNEEGYFDD